MPQCQVPRSELPAQLVCYIIYKHFIFFQAEDGIRDLVRSRGLGDVYKRQHLDGICFYDGKSFTNFVIHPLFYKPETSSLYRSYSAYCTLVDKSSNVWFGTQEKGVCVYDGKRFSFLNDKDLAGPAVRSIYQDKAGILWFGNNGGGFYRYDGKTLRNITEENTLGKYKFLINQKLFYVFIIFFNYFKRILVFLNPPLLSFHPKATQPLLNKWFPFRYKVKSPIQFFPLFPFYRFYV